MIDQMLVALDGAPKGMRRVSSVVIDPTGLQMGGRVTVDHLGKHQHFEFRGRYERREGDSLPVFEWLYCTAIAE